MDLKFVYTQWIKRIILIKQKRVAKYTAPKKLDTYWGQFYVHEQKHNASF